MGDNYQKYKELKHLLMYIKDDIDFIFPLSIDIMSVAHKERISILKIFASFFVVYNFTYLFSKRNKENVLFTNAYNRPEYSKFLNLIRSDIANSNYIHLKNVDLVPHINFITIFSSLGFAWKVLFKKTSIKNILFIASRLSFYRNTISVLSELEKTTDFFDFKKYIAFNGQYGTEALLVQFFKRKGVQTFSLTHGKTYVKYKNMIPPDIINGENIAADKVLTWGATGTNELMENFGVAAESIVTAGNPVYPIKKLDIKQSFTSGIILLGRKIYDAGNTDILRIAGELSAKKNIKFSVRLHPSLSLNYYSKICNEHNLILTSNQDGLQEMFLGGQYDFAIVNNSTTYYESMYHDMVCFRYEPDENEIYEGLEDKFTDLDSLDKKIELFKVMNTQILNSGISKLLSDNLGMGINLYKEILDTP